MYAGVLELVDEADSKSVGLITRVGSSPTTGTIPSVFTVFEDAVKTLGFFMSNAHLRSLSVRDVAHIDALFFSFFLHS